MVGSPRGHRVRHDWETFTFTSPPLQPSPWRAEQTAVSGLYRTVGDTACSASTRPGGSIFQKIRPHSEPPHTRPSSLLSFSLGTGANPDQGSD